MSTNKINATSLFLCTFLVVFTTPFSVHSRTNDSFIEFTQSTSSDTLDRVSTIGLYSNFGKFHSLLSYGGVQVAQFRNADIRDDHSVMRIFAGQAIKGAISPFFEVGTDLYGFLVMLSDNNNRDECKDDRKCTVDAYFRFGVRINLFKQYKLGIFHENISFGDFHTHLKGEHNYTGASLSFNF